MSLHSAIRREFVERMGAWVQAERPEVWAEAKGDPFAALWLLTESEGARVFAHDLERGGGRLWFAVGGDRVIGVEWVFGAFGVLERLDWWGFDPMEPQRSAGREGGARRYHPETGETLN